jgi:hypothetical protein
MPITGTIVSLDAVQVDETLLVEMSDGSLREMYCWRKLAAFELRSLRYLRPDQLVEQCRRHNAWAMMQANINLHHYKLHRYGEGYHLRGY